MRVSKISNVILVENYLTRAHNLRGHVKSIHEGHKDFNCESCGRLFTRAYSMRKHIKTVHEGHLTLVN